VERVVLYQIHRYPAELIDVVHIAGGRVVIRPVLPQDAELTGAFFRALSAPARYDRFLSPMRELPEGLLRRFSEIDYSDHLALVAEVFIAGRERVIAEARYVRELRSGDAAQFAIAVDEAWQGRGLARLLLAKLACRAAVAGISRLQGETLASNARMLRLARRAGFGIAPSPDTRGLMLLDKTLATRRADAVCGELDADSLAAA
jgi:acetyltransferase